MASDRIPIIGVGDDGLAGLTEASRRLIEEADLLVGASQALAVAPQTDAERLDVSDLEAVVERISAAEGKRIVVMMIGDPLFYGTARFLCDRLGKERFDVTPHVSSMQLAFARVKESWDEAYLANLATQGLERVVDQVRGAEKVGLFTSEEHPPSAVAQALLERRIDYFSAYVCENLGSPDERVTSADLDELVNQSFAPLNVMILARKPDRPDQPSEGRQFRLFGNPDDVFLQSKPKRGLLTPSEVRCVALAELALHPGTVMWDVGAGSGSVAIEAAQIASSGHVHSIEMDVEDYQLISKNAEHFGVSNVTPVLGKAPEAWDGLPDPDAIFVGGTGRQIRQIVEQAFDRLQRGGRLVANVVSIENVAAVREALHAKTEADQVWMINVARGTYQLETVRFESLNPTFLIAAVKK